MLLLQIPLSGYPDNYIDYDSGYWNTLTTIHFEIVYPNGCEGLAIRAAELAESGYVRVSDYLDHEITSTITIIMYPSNHGFQRDDIFDAASGMAHGILIVPFHGSYAELRRTMTREIVFAFQHDILAETGPNSTTISSLRIPLWFSLGLADYIAYGYDDRAETALLEIIRENHHAGIRDLNDGNLAQCRREGRAFFFFIEKQYGKKSIGEMLRDFGGLGYLNDVIYSATGKTVEEIDMEWAGFLGSRYEISKKKHHRDDKTIRPIEGLRLSEGLLISAVSPDGAKIACLVMRGEHPELIILAADRKTDKKKYTGVMRSSLCGRFESVHPADNNLTWTGDNKYIVMAARSNGHEYVYFIKADNGSTQCRIPLPFSAVAYPSVSHDGRRIAFTGIAGSSEDIYIYDRNEKKIIRVTDDDFSDRYPVIAPDGRNVIYSSNWNTDGDVARDEYAIYRQDIQTAKRTMLVGGGENNIQADISADGKKMLYVSDRSGIYNAYVYDFLAKNNEKITDSAAGIFLPRWFPDSSRFACMAYHEAGYALFVKDSNGRGYPETDMHIHDAVKASYHESYVDTSGFFFSTYNYFIKPAWLHIGGAGTFNNGYLCFMQFGMSDYLGRHSLVFTSSYSREYKYRNNDVNADIAYYYRSRRWNFGTGIFRQASPIFASSIGMINDWTRGPDFGIISMEHYGGYASAGYSFNRFAHVTLRTAAGRYEKLYPDSEHRKDLRTTAGNISLSFEYDNVLRGAMVPVSGFMGRLQAEQCIDFTGRNSFSNVSIDLQRFFLIGRRFIIALRGAGGTLIGKNRGHFNYYLGGYDTLRGHDMLSVSGRNMFLVNVEFRLAGADWMNFGLPLSGGLGNLAAVAFIDAGSAWDGRFSMVDGKTGRFGDFKMDFGVGIRVALYPVLILKLDFAWPFDKKSIKKNDILFSAGFMY
jgi:hypothetical protein